MQSFRNEERFLSKERSRVISPYARRTSPTPYLFGGRNFDSPRGRTHVSGDSRLGSDYKRKMASSGIENVSPLGYRCVDPAIGEIKRIFGDFQRNLDDFKSRHSVPVLGNLSSTESNVKSSWILRGDRDTNGKGENSKREILSGPSKNLKTKSFSEDYPINRREYQSRLLTGSVDRVLQWFQLRSHFNLLFEVIAPLADIKSGKFPTEKCLLLRDDKNGPFLVATFCEIDRSLPTLVVGHVVKCVGRMTSRNSLQAFRVEQISDEEMTNSQRLFFMSGLVAEEAKTLLKKK